MLPLFKQILENFRFDIDPELSRDENVEEVIKSAALLSGAIAVEPVPFADVLLITPVQAKMVLHIGKIYGYEIDQARALDIAKELGATIAYGFAARQIMRGVVKTIAPIIGGVVTAPLVYGWTYGLGRLAQRYFERKIAGQTFTKTEQKQFARTLPAVEKPTLEALGDFAKELRNRAAKREENDLN